MYNFFSAILDGSKALNNAGAFEGVKNLGQSISQTPTAQSIKPVVQQASQDISNTVSPFINTARSAVQPIKNEYDYTTKIVGVKSGYAKQLGSLGLTAQMMDDMGFSEEEKQAVKSIYDQVGATIPGLEEQAQKMAQMQQSVQPGEDLLFFGSAYEGLKGGFRVGEHIPKYAGNLLDLTQEYVTTPLVAGGAEAIGADEFAQTWRKAGAKFGEGAKRIGQEITAAGMTNGGTNPLTQKQIDMQNLGANLVATAPIPLGISSKLLKGAGLGKTALRGAIAGGVGTPIYTGLEEGRLPTDEEIVTGIAGGAVLGPIAEKLVIPGAIGLANKTGQYGKALVKGGTQGLKQSLKEDISGVGQNISQKYSGVRQYLSGLEPKEATALGKTSVEEFDTILNRAKEAVGPNADYTQTPYYVFDEASDTLSKIDDNLSTRQAERIAILDEAPIATIDATDARNTLRSALRSMNVEDIRMVDGVPTIIPVKGREALLDMTNQSDVKALQKLNEILDGDVSPTQTMDRIKKLQEWAYENQSSIGVKGTSERMNKLIKQVQGSLNSTFKKQLPEEYTKVLESMSEDIKLSDDIKRLFGIDDAGNQVGNRGELLMKRILSGTTTGGEARSLAERILKRYGIDFTRQARLRQLAMDLVGDERGKTLFQSIKEGKSGIIDTVLQKTLGKVVNKEGVARTLAKGKGDTVIKPKTLYTPNAFRKAMAEDARKPLALPAPSGKPVSAKSVNLNPITGTPKIQGEVGKQGMRPGTTKKQELKKQEAMKLLPSPRLPEGTSFPRTDIVAESIRGLSSNVKRPNGTPLRNNQDISPSTNTQGSKQTLKPSPKPLKNTSTNDKKGVVVPETSKKLAMSKKTGTESKLRENGGKEAKKLNKPKALRVYDIIKSKNNDITAVPFDDFYSLAKASTKGMTKDKAWGIWMDKILKKVEIGESVDVEILKKYPLAGVIIKDFIKTKINPFE